MAKLHRMKSLVTCCVFGALLAAAAAGSAAPLELSVTDSVSLALKNNPAITVAEQEREKSRWGVEEAKTGQSVSAGFSHAATRTRPDPSKSNAGVNTNFDNKISLVYPLYTGGKTEGLIDQAKLNLKITDLGVEKAQQQVRLDATTAYFKLLQTRNLMELNRESVDRLAAHLANVKLQHQAGTVAKTDVLRSEVELADAEQNLIRAENNHQLALASLNHVLGLSLDTEIAVKEVLRYETAAVVLAECVEYALKHRPEVGQAKASVTAAGQSVNIAASGYRPSVTATAATGWNDEDFPGLHNHNWSIGITANYSIFDSGLTKSKVKQADAAVAAASAQDRNTRDSVELEVRQAYLNLKEAEKRIVTSKVAVGKAEEDYQIAQVRYHSGVGTNLDVIDAQLALTQAKTNHVQALYDHKVSRAQLDRAMGVAVN
ncbi:MAG: type secretion outer membrane protein TolC family [Anaerosporomusa subterranea]|nr:type secretion outer membrane protein TolC family [Anaerosporomusa subterranea]